MAIPKKIHYCWFGKNRKSSLIEHCIDSWRDILKDYEIIEWNEDNFNINSNQYVKEAYNAKKWAFVSDYVRLWVLKQYGGIYLDTDVEVFKSFDVFLKHGFFTGYEEYFNDVFPVTAVMGAEQNHKLLAKLLSEYEHLNFLLPDGSYNSITNTVRITKMLVNKYGVEEKNNKYQVLDNNIHIYPSDFFCVKSENSYSMHHFEGSWLPVKEKVWVYINSSKRIPRIFRRIFNKYYWMTKKSKS